MLPALAGLGAPWWRPEAHAVVAGLTAAARPAHVVRATLDGIAHRVADVVEAMAGVLPGTPVRLRVDGGMTANSYLMQRQADLLGIPVDVASVEESTALGIAGLAGLGVATSTRRYRCRQSVACDVPPRAGRIRAPRGAGGVAFVRRGASAL